MSHNAAQQEGTLLLTYPAFGSSGSYPTTPSPSSAAPQGHSAGKPLLKDWFSAITQMADVSQWEGRFITRFSGMRGREPHPPHNPAVTDQSQPDPSPILTAQTCSPFFGFVTTDLMKVFTFKGTDRPQTTLPVNITLCPGDGAPALTVWREMMVAVHWGHGE